VSSDFELDCDLGAKAEPFGDEVRQAVALLEKSGTEFALFVHNVATDELHTFGSSSLEVQMAVAVQAGWNVRHRIQRESETK